MRSLLALGLAAALAAVAACGRALPDEPASAGDGGTSVGEGGSSGSSGSNGGGVCPGTVLFGPDGFDRAAPLGTNLWNSIEETGTPPAIDEAEGSPLPSLLSAIAARSSGDEGRRLVWGTGGPGTVYCVEFDARVDVDQGAFGTDANAIMFQMRADVTRASVPTTVHAALAWAKDGLRLAIPEPSVAVAAINLGPERATWMHYVFRIDFRTGVAAMEIGSVRGDVTAAVQDATVTQIRFYLGVRTSGPVGTTAVHYDNFRVTYDG